MPDLFDFHGMYLSGITYLSSMVGQTTTEINSDFNVDRESLTTVCLHLGSL